MKQSCPCCPLSGAIFSALQVPQVGPLVDHPATRPATPPVDSPTVGSFNPCLQSTTVLYKANHKLGVFLLQNVEGNEQSRISIAVASCNNIQQNLLIAFCVIDLQSWTSAVKTRS